jgi:hypothetical protein
MSVESILVTAVATVKKTKGIISSFSRLISTEPNGLRVNAIFSERVVGRFNSTITPQITRPNRAPYINAEMMRLDIGVLL